MNKKQDLDPSFVQYFQPELNPALPLEVEEAPSAKVELWSRAGAGERGRSLVSKLGGCAKVSVLPWLGSSSAQEYH